MEEHAIITFCKAVMLPLYEGFTDFFMWPCKDVSFRELYFKLTSLPQVSSSYAIFSDTPIDRKLSPSTQYVTVPYVTGYMYAAIKPTDLSKGVTLAVWKSAPDFFIDLKYYMDGFESQVIIIYTFIRICHSVFSHFSQMKHVHHNEVPILNGHQVLPHKENDRIVPTQDASNLLQEVIISNKEVLSFNSHFSQDSVCLPKTIRDSKPKNPVQLRQYFDWIRSEKHNGGTHKVSVKKHLEKY